jgi:hypothetical protein
MASLPVILIKDSTASLQSNLSKLVQYVPVSEPSKSSTHPKALFPYPVLPVSIPILNM